MDLVVTELILFIVFPMLFFWIFHQNSNKKTWECFSYFWRVLTEWQGFSCLPALPHQPGLQGIHKRLKRDTAGTADLSWAKGCPMAQDAVPSNRSWGRKEEGRSLGVMAFFFPSYHYAWWGSAFLEMAGHLSGYYPC